MTTGSRVHSLVLASCLALTAPALAADPELSTASAKLAFSADGDPQDSRISVFVQRGATVVAKAEDLEMSVGSGVIHTVPLTIAQVSTQTALAHGTITVRMSGGAPAGLNLTLDLELGFVEAKADGEEKTSVKRTITAWTEKVIGTNSQTFRATW